jgi:hypothetical protein
MNTIDIEIGTNRFVLLTARFRPKAEAALIEKQTFVQN